MDELGEIFSDCILVRKNESTIVLEFSEKKAAVNALKDSVAYGISLSEVGPGRVKHMLSTVDNREERRPCICCGKPQPKSNFFKKMWKSIMRKCHSCQGMWSDCYIYFHDDSFLWHRKGAL